MIFFFWLLHKPQQRRSLQLLRFLELILCAEMVQTEPTQSGLEFKPLQYWMPYK